MKKLNYFECVQNEVIRMASPSPTCFMRIADEDMQFVDIDLKKGTNVLIEPMANHFNEKYFPNPFEFNPERWTENKNAPVPFTFTGFLGGPRTCLGKHLAFLESKIVIVKLLRRYKKM
jgi:cytochrome P450